MIAEAIDTVTEKIVTLFITNQRLLTHALWLDPFVVAAENGDAFTWSTTFSSGDNNYLLYLRNTDATRLLHIVEINIGGKEEGRFTLYSSTGDGGNGTNSAEFNMDFSGVAAPAIHKEGPINIGDLGSLTQIGYRTTPLFESENFNMRHALVLGEDDAIVVQNTKGGDDTSVTIMGYYE